MAANPRIYTAAIIIMLAAVIIQYFTDWLTGFVDISMDYLNSILDGENPEAARNTLLQKVLNIDTWVWLYMLASSIFQYLLDVGFVIYTLRLCRAKEVKISALMDGFGIALRVIGLYVVEKIFVTLWSLLFIVPGIIASYRYRLALYILIEHPEYSILKCIRESKRLMRGRKGELFVLDLSFIGWTFLTAIRYVGNIFAIYVIPYKQMTYVNYYIAVKNLDDPAYIPPINETPPNIL